MADLIAFYSRKGQNYFDGEIKEVKKGNTEIVAEKLQEMTGAEVFQIKQHNPDGVEIKKLKDENGVPLDGIPFHPYYTVKDILGVVVFILHET